MLNFNKKNFFYFLKKFELIKLLNFKYYINLSYLVIEGGFNKYMESFVPYLNVALQAHEEYQVIIISIFYYMLNCFHFI